MASTNTLNYQGKKVAWAGTSRTYAVGATPSTRWTKILCDTYNGIEYNYGVAGATLLPGDKAFDKTQIPFYDSTFASHNFEFGTNEVVIHGGNGDFVAPFKEVYREVIRFAIEERNWNPALLSIQNCYYPATANPEVLPLYNQAMLEVAKEFNVVYIDYYSAFHNRSDINSLFLADKVHENGNTGQQALVDFYASVDYTPVNNSVGTSKLIATRCKYPATGYNAGSGTFTYISKHFVKYASTNVQVGYSNNGIANLSETPFSNSILVTCSIEVNGIIYPFKFSAASSYNLEIGELKLTDKLSISIPANSTIKIRTCITGDDAPTALFLDSANGEGRVSGTDDTLKLVSNDVRSGWGFTPVLITGDVSDSAYKSVLLVGDSITKGVNDDTNHSYLERALEVAGYPYTNLAIAGDKAKTVVQSQNNAARSAIAKATKFTNAISGYLTNDIQEVATDNEFKVIANNLWSWIKSLGIPKVAQITLLPKTDSTDNWITATNQTPFRDFSRIPLNEYIRSLPTGLDSVIDGASLVEVNSSNVLTKNGGFWIANGSSKYATLDGVHPSTAIHALLGANLNNAINALFNSAVVVPVPTDKYIWKITRNWSRPIDPKPTTPTTTLTDKDPFLITWESGARISGKLPITTEDIYLTDNYNESDFSEMIDGETSNFYGGRVKLRSPFATTRFDVRKYRMKLEKIRVFMRGTYNDIDFYYTPKGSFDRTLLGVATNGAGWVELLVTGVAKDITNIEMVSKASPNENEGITDFPNQVEIYGSYVVPAMVTPTVRKPQFKKLLGINAFEWNVLTEPREQRIELLRQHYNFRHYLDRVHLEPAKGDFYFSPSYNGAGSWDYDDMYKRLKESGHIIRACIKNVPEWMQLTFPENLRSSESLPVEFEKDLATTLEKAKLPASYIDEGRLFFQFVARYGSVVVADNLLSVHTETGGGFPNNTKRSGLNYVSVMEGSNEGDSWWHGTSGCMTAEMSAARDSCLYDGHMGLLGANIGVKAADPNMLYHSFGQANATVGFVKAKIEWCRKHRGYNADGTVNVPWDALNYHQYSNDAGSVQNGGNTSRGMAPELSGWTDRIQLYHKVSDELLGGMPVTLGEYGFDVAEFSDQSAIRLSDILKDTKGNYLYATAYGNPIANDEVTGKPVDTNNGLRYRLIAGSDKTVRKFVQAQWMLRSALIAWVKGLDTLDVYMLDDVGSDEFGHYAQGGLSNSFENPTRRASGNFFYQAKQLIGEFTVGTVASTVPYVVRAVNENNVAYVMWSPTETDSKTNYVLNLPNGGILHNLSTDNTTTVKTVLPAGDNTIEVTETPCFIILNESTGSESAGNELFSSKFSTQFK